MKEDNLQQAGGVPAGWRETAELVWDALTGSHAGDLSADGQAKYMRAVQALDNLLSAHSPSAVQPTVEQAIVQLVEALVQSKGWLHAYADARVRDAIDSVAVQPLSEAQIEVLRFLDGVGDLHGFGFGDKPPTERGNYWWRKDLRAAFPDVDFGIVTPKEPTP